MILQGSAVTLRFDVGSTLVMELEEVEAIINNLKLVATEINISAAFSGFICKCTRRRLRLIFYYLRAANKCFLSVNWRNDL